MAVMRRRWILSALLISAASLIKRNPVIALGYFKSGGGAGRGRRLSTWASAILAGKARRQGRAEGPRVLEEGGGGWSRPGPRPWRGDGLSFGRRCVGPDAALARRFRRGGRRKLNDPSGLVVLGGIASFKAGELDAAKANWTRALEAPSHRPHRASCAALPPTPPPQQGADLLKLIDYRQRQGRAG